MLEVQKFLIKNHRQSEPRYNFSLLESELGIKCNYHLEYPLVILNYDQLDSPKLHPIVMECRGLVLDTTNYDVVASCMKRFFNLGEATEITDKFDWTGPINSLVKEDGSLMSLFFNPYSRKWEVKTRASWANQTIGKNMPQWDELFFSLLPKDFLKKASRDFTFVFEMCSVYNQVVRLYTEPKLFLLTAIDCRNNNESEPIALDIYARGLIERPAKIDVTDVDAVRAYIKELEETDGTAEGLVLQDKNGLRIKVKSKTYLAYSQLSGNGNICMDKNLVPLILANEQDEAIAIFPAIEPRVRELQEMIFNLYNTLVSDWNKCKEIDDQKEFALTIAKNNFSSILFRMKKDGTIKNIDNLKNLFYNSTELILKVIKDI